ncbi:hypothetical protein TDB9533_03439 [Thalassocella blandensis]|nr:hypothetical protein TDB9533_03439 [Thalassocella blandensis]
MPSHFSSIGFNIASEEDLIRVTQSLLETAVDVACFYGRYRKWSQDGIEMWLHFNEKNEFIGITPAYTATSSIAVALTKEIENDYPFDGTFHAWLNPQGEEPDSGDFPFVFDIPDRACFAELELPKLTHMNLSAFAHNLSVFEDEQSFYDSQTEEPSFAVESFIPSGLFVDEGASDNQPSAMAFFTGRVVASECKTNPMTGLEFFWAKIKTLGCELDIVVDPALCESLPAPGHIVSGSFWLCGSFMKGL